MGVSARLLTQDSVSQHLLAYMLLGPKLWGAKMAFQPSLGSLLPNTMLGMQKVLKKKWRFKRPVPPDVCLVLCCWCLSADHTQHHPPGRGFQNSATRAHGGQGASHCPPSPILPFVLQL